MADLVVAPEKVLEGIQELGPVDQIAVIAMRDGRYEIFSSHIAEEMENMIDDALDALYEGRIGFDEE